VLKYGICRDFDLSESQTLYCEIGSLRLWLKKIKSEVILAHCQSEEVDEFFSYSEDEIPENAKQTRWSWEGSKLEVSLAPTLHDRDLVFRAMKPIFLPSKERVDFYVSPCVKLQISFNGKFIINLPIIRYSETWFGKDPTIGDLCYAVKTRGTIDPDEIIKKKYRFICHVSVYNEGASPISIDKLKVLTEYLRLYQDGEGYLYSDSLVIKQSEDSVKIAMSKPHITGKTLKKVFDARTALQTIFMKAFSVLLEH